MPPTIPAVPIEVTPSLTQQQIMMNDAMEKAKKAAELQARIQAQLNRTGISGIGMHLQQLANQ